MMKDTCAGPVYDYRPDDTVKVGDFKRRVIDELSELSEKRKKLMAFINENALFPTLPVNEQVRLKYQAVLMTEYAQVLAARVNNDFK